MRANYSDEQLETVNRMIMSGDIVQVTMVLDGAKAQMQATNGMNGRTLLGGVGQDNANSQGFSSQQEMITAMKDPRYGRDRAYTLEIERKVSKSTFF